MARRKKCYKKEENGKKMEKKGGRESGRKERDGCMMERGAE